MKKQKNAIQCLRDIVRLNPPAECITRAQQKEFAERQSLLDEMQDGRLL